MLFLGVAAPFRSPTSSVCDLVSFHPHWHLLCLVFFVLAVLTDMYLSLLFKNFLSRYFSKAKDISSREGFGGNIGYW